jgi:predicted DCC family thiol-disulfide oxidoreductase YuxK
VLTKSDAAIHILGRLGGLWTLLELALRIVPRTLRNFAYDCVGKIRHRLGEQPDAMCPILPALRKLAVTRLGDLWGLDLSRFLCGDAA